MTGTACGGTSTPLPQATASPSPVATASAAPAEVAPTPEPVAEVAPTPEAAPVASTCDVAREAILTGTPAKIEESMKALVADKSANATAREYARYYMVRDAGDKQLREMDVSLIQMSCTS